MNNELIVIEPATALKILSSKQGTDKLVDEVRIKVMSLEGGKMDTITGRKQIRSNAFKATKSKAPVKKMVTDLIAVQESKMAPYVEIIDALKDNYNDFAAGMDKIRKDTNAEVDAFEDKIKQAKSEKAELARIALIDKDWDFAQMLMKEYFSLIERGDAEVAYMEKLEAEKVEQERIAREKLIAEKAAADAKLKAEQKAEAEKQRLEKEKQDAIDAQKLAEQQADDQRKAAIQADIDLEAEKELAREKEANIKEERRVDYHKRMIQHIVDCGNGVIGGKPQSFGILFFELENKIVIDDSFEEFKDQAESAKKAALESLRSMQEKQIKASEELEQRRIKDKADADELAEKNRLEAIEQTKRDEAQKIAIAEEAEAVAAATRKANTKHVTNIKTAIKLSLMKHAGLSEPDAINATKALFSGKIEYSSVTI